MLHGPTEATARLEQHASHGDAPPTDVVDFIRFCYRRRPSGWPDLYEEMCGVAARREFKGWGHEQLSARGVTFSLCDMQRLAGWVRAVLPSPVQLVEPTPLIPERTYLQRATA